MFLQFFAGLYEELRRIEPDFAFSPRDSDGGVADQRAFIVLGFKTLDDASRGSFQSEVYTG